MKYKGPLAKGGIRPRTNMQRANCMQGGSLLQLRETLLSALIAAQASQATQLAA